MHQPCKLISLRSRAILEAHQEPQPRADRLLPLNSPSNGGLEGFSPLLTLAPRGGLALPTITECQLGCQAGNHSEGLPFRHTHPCACLCPPLCRVVDVVCLGLPPPSPSCREPAASARNHQSQPRNKAKELSLARRTQLQPRLPSPPSLIQALLCIRKSHSYFLGRAAMTKPTCSRSSIQGCEPGTLR